MCSWGRIQLAVWDVEGRWARGCLEGGLVEGAHCRRRAVTLCGGEDDTSGALCYF